MSKWYAVKVGKIPGIYTSWNLCKLQTSGFSGSVFKSFSTREAALEYFYEGNVPDNEKKPAPLMVSKSASFIEMPKIRGVPNDTKLLDIVVWDQDIEECEPYFYGDFIPFKVEDSSKPLTYDRRILDTHKNLLVVYIDGSKRPTVNHRGSGAYCRFLGADYYLSVPFTPEVGAKYQISPDDYNKLSSPTMEYLALAEILWRFIKIRIPEVDGIPQILNPRLKIIFVADYNGVKHWTNGDWNTKEDYIKKIRTTNATIIGFLKAKGIDITIHHCNGHIGILGNELSDAMAKSTSFFDTIVNLVEDLSNSFTK